MKKKKINLRSSSLFAIVFCLMLGFLFSKPVTAQTVFDPHVNCVNGCTAKDIKNISAALVQPDPPNNVFPANFSCNSGQNVNVKLAVFLQTNTQKAGIYVYAHVRRSSDNFILGTASECFSTGALTTVGDVTKVVFTQSLTWLCGTAIKLTDVYVAWGTGNTDFCLGSPDPRCPATTSKCFALPEGEYIPVVIPGGAGASQTKCSTTPGGTTATFNLTESDATIKNGQTGVHVRWYSDAGGTTELTGTGKTAFVNTSNPQTVYAKVCNDPSPGTVCSALQNVVLTVTPTPAAPVLSKVDNCNGTTTITAKDGSNVDIPAGELTWSNGASGNPINVNNTTAVTATRTVNNCTSAASTSVTPAPKTTPAAPILSKVDNCNGTTTITAKDGSNVNIPAGELTWSNGGNGNPINVNNTTAITATRTVNGCISAASNSITPAPKTTPDVPSATVIQPTCSTATGSITVNSPDATITYTLTGPSPAITTQSNTTGIFSGLAPGTYGLTASKNGCTSGSASKIVNQPLSNPSFTVCLVQPTLCANSGSVTVNATGGSGFTYKLNNGAPQASNVFSNLASGSVTSITVTNSDGCSATVSCSSLVQSCPAPPGARISTPQQIESTASTTTVKAYPNPFSDRVKFMVTSTVAGNGNLEIYNMMGQKVKTVYQGYIAAGTQIFELSLPGKQVANMVYVLRIGDKKMTGKILQINQ